MSPVAILYQFSAVNLGHVSLGRARPQKSDPKLLPNLSCRCVVAYNPGLFFGHFQKTQGPKNSTSKKLKAIFCRKTQYVGIF